MQLLHSGLALSSRQVGVLRASASTQATSPLAADAAAPSLTQKQQSMVAEAERGDSTALLNLGLSFVHGLHGFSKSAPEAVRNLHAAAKLGSAEAAYWLGYTLKHADSIISASSTPADVPSAAEPAESAAEAHARLSAGRAVLAELRAMRKTARKAKTRREAGLPTKPEHAAFDPVGVAAERSVPLTPPPLPPASIHDKVSTTSSVGGITVSTVSAKRSAPSNHAVSAKSGSVADRLPGEAERGGDFPPCPPPIPSAAKAHYWWLRAAQAGSSDACVALGNLYLERGAENAPSEAPLTPQAMAAQWYSLATTGEASLPSAGQIAAQVAACADIPRWGAGDIVDAAAHPPLTPPSAGQGVHTDGAYNLAMLLQEGAPGVAQDKSTAWELFRLAAVLGDASALFWLGVVYHTGEGAPAHLASPPPHVNTSVRFLELATRAGHGAAALYLSRMYRGGVSTADSAADAGAGAGPPPDDARARFFLQQAVALGDAEAMFETGDAAYHGRDGAERDRRAALQWFLRAGAAGHATALYNAAAMTYAGEGGVSSSAAGAFQLYQQAGEAGSLEAWGAVAQMYALGDGVPKNATAAKYITDMLKSLQAQAPA